MSVLPADGESRPLLAASKSGSNHSIEQESALPARSKAETVPDLKIILLALWSAVFLGALDGTIAATLLSSIGSHFQRAHQASYIGTAYLLSVCCFTPLYGRLCDILGRKGAMVLAQTLFASGTLLCGVAPSMETLIVARAIAGMGGGGVMTVSSITVTDLIPLKQRGLYQGLANILFGVGAGLGGPAGGFINDHFGWRWAFLFQVPLLLLSMILVMCFLNVTLPVRQHTLKEKLLRIDYLGSLTLVLAVGSVTLAATLQSTEERPITHPVIWGLYLCCGISTVSFVAVEGLVAKEPIMPLRLLTQRTPAAVAVNNFLFSAVGFSMLYNYPLYFTAVKLTTAQTSGLHLLPNAIALGSGSVVAGLYMRSTGKFYWFSAFCALAPVASSLSMATWGPRTSTIRLWLDIVPSGFGLSAFITTTLIALIASVDREDIAVATGISYLFRTTGQVIGVAASSAILQSLLLSELRKRITGPGASELITSIRHSTTIIPRLDPPIRDAAIEAYRVALRAVFVFQAAVAFFSLVAALPVEENPLPGSHEEQAQQDERRRQRQSLQQGSQ